MRIFTTNRAVRSRASRTRPIRSGPDPSEAARPGSARPGTVGIALSGGGIRAGAFGLGGLQALQESRGLLRGPRAARWLSGVSGGGYTASAVTMLNAGSRVNYVGGAPIGARDLSDDEWPLQPDSDEYRHVLKHTDYLLEGGAARLLLEFLGLFALLALMLGGALVVIASLLAGGALAGVTVAHVVGWHELPAIIRAPAWHGPLAVVGLLSVIWMVFLSGYPHGLTRGRRLVRTALRIVALLLTLACASFAVATLRGTPLLASPAWLGRNIATVAIVLGAIVVGLVALFLLGTLRPLAPLRSVVGAFTTLLLGWGPGLLAAMVTCWAAVALYRAGYDFATADSRAGQLVVPLALVLVVVAMTVFRNLPGAVSLHVPYRRFLAQCFAIARLPGGASPIRSDRVAMSSLLWRPGAPNYPDLILGASANLSDHGIAPAGSHVLSMAMTSEHVRISPRPETEFTTASLEMLPGRRMVFALRQPALSLGSAVAISGAALSPEMGRMTRAKFRTLLTALNVRLGVWLPNPLLPAAHTAVESRDPRPFAVGFPQLFMELIGLNPSNSPVVYTTDGGHCENLGIVELLRRGCSEIWAVDSSTDPPGRAPSLVQTLLIAEAELGCRVDLDVGRFALDTDGRPRHVHAHGTVRYADGTTAALHVVRLGITARHSSIIAEYARVDRPFPFHSILNQIYRSDRFEAYVRLGRESMEMALADAP